MSAEIKARYRQNPRVEVDHSPIHGYGLFARKFIAKDDFIGRYEGRRTQKNGMHVLWVWDEDNNRWTGVDGDNEMRFLNHSSEPNAEFYDTELYALRDIPPGEEICFDYQWDDDQT